MHLLEVVRRGHDLVAVFVRSEIVGTCLERQFHQCVLIGVGALDDDLPLALEEPGHRTGAGELPAGFRDDVPNVGGGTVAVVRVGVGEHRHAARRKNLVSQLLVMGVVVVAGGALDGAVDIIRRHVGAAALEQDHPQARVQVRLRTADPDRNANLTGQLGEHLRLLGIGGALFPLDRRPLAMTRHGIN